MKPMLLTLLAGLAVIPAREAQAADIYCSGRIAEYLVQADGMVTIRSTWRNDWTSICSLKGSWKTIDIPTCAVWVGIIQKAIDRNLNAGIYFINPTFTCANYPTYSESPAPFYLRLHNPVP